MAKSSKRGRSAITGRYTKLSTARRFSKTHVVENIKRKRKRKN